MQPEEVRNLMESSRTEEEWNASCTKVKEKCDGYPSFWFKEIVASGLAGKVASRWDGNDRIDVQTIGIE
jgi:hypothetical protein